MPQINGKIVTARKIASDLNSVQIFLSCRPANIPDPLLSELIVFQADVIEDLESTLCGIDSLMRQITQCDDGEG